jgi:hypothetical protein
MMTKDSELNGIMVLLHTVPLLLIFLHISVLWRHCCHTLASITAHFHTLKSYYLLQFDTISNTEILWAELLSMKSKNLLKGIIM